MMSILSMATFWDIWDSYLIRRMNVRSEVSCLKRMDASKRQYFVDKNLARCPLPSLSSIVQQGGTQEEALYVPL